ncbi:MAG TPA: hypothetical protein VMV18_06240, partial [bacterium]|nr:hypothetical protein [bacterium]
VGLALGDHQVDDPGEGFHAVFPASPVATSDGTMTELAAEDLGWTYTVRYASIPDGLAVDREYLEHVRDRVVGGERPAMGVSETSILDVPGGIGLGFAAHGESSSIMVGRVMREDRRVFALTVRGKKRVAESPDTKRFLSEFAITPRPEPVKTPSAAVARLEEGAARSAAQSYVALVGTGRYDEAWRYLPPSARARITPQAHAAWWKKNLPPAGFDDALVTTVVVHGTSADISVIGGKQTVKLVAEGQARTASVIPAALVPPARPPS